MVESLEQTAGNKSGVDVRSGLRMKISCTKREKSVLIIAIRDFTGCSFLHRDEKCEEIGDCDKCVEQAIEWQIEDGDGEC